MCSRLFPAITNVMLKLSITKIHTKIEEKRGVFLGSWVSQHVSHGRDMIVAVCLISKTRTAVRDKILLKSILKLQLYHSLDTARALIQ